jgi:hypothetical protein
VDFLPIMTTTAGLASSALNSLKQARDLAKNVADNDLKQQIGEAYDALLSLREHLLNLDEENRTLKAQLAAKAAYVGPIAPHGYYFAANDAESHQHPLCPICFQSQPQKIAYMTDAQDFAGGVGRECKVCNKVIFEKATTQTVTRIVPRTYSPY